MNIEMISDSKLVADLGGTLLHSVWQIALIATVLHSFLLVSKKASPSLRYSISVAALVLSFIIPAATFLLSTNSAQPGTISDSIEDVRYTPLSSESAVVDGLQAGSQVDDHFEDGERRLPVPWPGIEEVSPAVLKIVVLIWVFGVVFSLLRLAGGASQVVRYKKCRTSAAEPRWKERFSSLCAELNVGRSVTLLMSELIDMPIAVGILKPLVIVPASAFLQLHPRELETVIAHELIHIRRYDPFVNAIQNAIEALLFYHPGARWISRQVRLEREFAADAAVLVHFGDSRVVYATALANLEAIRQSAAQLPSAANAANGGNLMLRIERILKGNANRSNIAGARRTGMAFLLIAAVTTGVIGFVMQQTTRAQRKTAHKQVAIGFVSIPPTDRSADPPKDAVSTARILIDALRSRSIPAIGFVQGGMISDGQKPYPIRANIVKMWRDAGFEIGVGGYKHIWFYNTPYQEYVENVEKNLSVIEPIVAEKGGKTRYFSYPFLNTGGSIGDRERFESWLKERGLMSVKYTMDNQEWMYSYAYDTARNDNDLNSMVEIRVAFINYMSKMFDHYEAYSLEMFGRDVPQTLVLTPSRLIADSADDLFGTLEKRGYSFVSMDEALADDAYKTREDFIGNTGISWFERWTLAQSKQLRAEPEVDRTVQQIWESRRAQKSTLRNQR